MENSDGTPWCSLDAGTSQKVMEQNEFECAPVEFWMALCMMYSDYSKSCSKSTALEIQLNFMPIWPVHFLKDKDAPKDKLARYYRHIVNTQMRRGSNLLRAPFSIVLISTTPRYFREGASGGGAYMYSPLSQLFYGNPAIHAGSPPCPTDQEYRSPKYFSDRNFLQIVFFFSAGGGLIRKPNFIICQRSLYSLNVATPSSSATRNQYWLRSVLNAESRSQHLWHKDHSKFPACGSGMPHGICLAQLFASSPGLHILLYPYSLTATTLSINATGQ